VPSSDAAHRHDAITIVSMAVIASAIATLLHEGVGHGLTAFVRGDVPTSLTSNHLSSLYPDRVVDAGGTIVNLIAGVVAMLVASQMKSRANARYFFWILGALNLLPGAGYFMFSGIFGFGDWNEVIAGMPHHAALRLAMTLGGIVLYVAFIRWLAVTVKPFVPERRMYNLVGRLPYVAAGLFSCAAGAFDPLGVQLLLVSTIPAAFGGSSGLLWADSLMPRGAATEPPAFVRRDVAWWVAAAVVGGAYIAVLGPGLTFPVS
jgi:hypothetical protein